MIEIPLTPEQFAAKRQQLMQQQGIVLPGDEGKISAGGVTASYIYRAGKLSVKILEKPFFVTEAFCEEKLREYLAPAS